MTMQFEELVLGWRTLKDIYRHYLAQTPSEEGFSATEVVDYAENGMREADVHAQTASGMMSSEQAAHARARIKEDKDQAKRMRAITAHIMTRDAVAGLWFAFGRKDGKGKHQFIHPHEWNFLLLDIENDAAGRDGLRYEDLRCAFTKDISEDHPVQATNDVPENHPTEAPIRPAAVTGTTIKQIVSPPTVPSPAQDDYRHDGPGRPSSFHLIDCEFRQRVRKNALEPSLAKQAEVLSAWFNSAHPDRQPYQPKTVANRLRRPYRAAMSPKKDPKL